MKSFVGCAILFLSKGVLADREKWWPHLPFLTVRPAMRCTACRICMRLAFNFSTNKMHERGQWAGGRFCPGLFWLQPLTGWAVGELCYLTQHAKRPSKWTEFRVATFEIYLFFLLNSNLKAFLTLRWELAQVCIDLGGFMYSHISTGVQKITWGPAKN